MPTEPPDSTLEPLLAHAAWVQRLAHRLVVDAHEADDLVQETWLAALGARWRKRESGDARPFLAGILRRRLLHRNRSEGRRRVHEDRARLSERAELRGPAPSAEEALERAELGRELTRLATELEEPFRSVLLLRYFSGLSAPAIARQLGVPLKTVESRLSRGRARLRERWLRRYPDDEASGLAALATLAIPLGVPPLAATPLATSASTSALSSSPSPLALGALIVNTKLALIAIAVACGGGLLWLKARPMTAPLVTAAERVESRVAAPDELDEPLASSSSNELAERTPEPSRSSSPNAVSKASASVDEPLEASAPPTLRRLTGRVVDPTTRPMPGVNVVFRSGAKEPLATTSGPDGRFELRAPVAPGSVTTEDEDLENLIVFSPRAEAEPELTLVVARHRPLGGTVRSEEGRPMPAVKVNLALPADLRMRFETVLDQARHVSFETLTDAEGRFHFPRAPLVEGATVEARREGYRTASVVPPTSAFDGLELVLARPEDAVDALVGRVLDEAGQPAAGAAVSLGHRIAMTADDGTFRLSRDEETRDAREIRAALAGHLPARFEPPIDPATSSPEWPDWLELRLGGPPLTLAGRVVDANGEPRPNVRIWLEDPTPFGILDSDDAAQLELISSPREPLEEGEELDLYFRSCSTDAEGRFLIEGLGERDYTLGLLDQATFAVTQAGPFTAGDDALEIQLDEVERAPLEGRLVSTRGAPVAGAEVTLHVHQFGGVHQSGQRVLTDPDGRFHFDPVARGDYGVWIRGDDILPTVRNLPSVGPTELEVELLCHIKVDLASRPELADSARILDADGELLRVYRIGAGSWISSHSARLIEGRSAPLGISHEATTLVLFLDGEEVRRLAIYPEPGELQVIRP